MRRSLTMISLTVAALIAVTGPATAQAPGTELQLTEEQRKAEAAFSLAHGFYTKGFYDRALEKLVEFVATYPTHTNAAYALFEAGECNFTQEKYAEAVPLYERVVKEYAQSDELDEAGYRLGTCKFRLDDFAAAVTAFTDVIAKTPDTQYKSVALYWTGEAQFSQQQWDEAIKSYDASFKAAPQGQSAAWSLYSIGMSQLKLGKSAEALAAFQRVATDYNDAPVAGECELRVADALQAQGNTAEARTAYNAVVKRGDADLMPGALHGLAWCEFDAEKWTAARAAFERLVKEHGENEYAVAARQRIGDCLYHEEKFAEAATAYEAALTGAPADAVPDILFWRAASLESAGDADAAEGIYQKLIDDHPDSDAGKKAALRLADALDNPDDLDKAEAAYKVAAASDDPKIRAEGLLGLARVAYMRGDKAGALAQYEKIATDDPASEAGGAAALQGAQIAIAEANLPKGNELAGLYLQHHGDTAEAPRAHYLRGFAIAGNDAKAAVAELDQAVAGPKADYTAAALKLLSKLARELGDNAKAEAALARLKKDFPDDAAAAEAEFETANRLFDEGKYPEARASYEAAIAATDDTQILAFSRLGIGAAYFREADYEKALAACQTVLNDHADVVAAAAPASYQAGVCLSRTGKFAEAAELLAKYVAENPDGDVIAQAKTELAWAYLQAGDADKARAIYETLADADGTQGEDALLRLGEMAYTAEDFAGALTRYEALIAKHADSDLIDEAQYKRGWCLTKLEKPDEAAAAFRACLAADPAPELAADSHYRVALWLVGKGDVAGAIPELVGFVGEYKDQPQAAYAATMLAELYASQEDWAAAADAVMNAPPTDVDRLEARRALVLGKAHRADGKPADAVEDFETALALAEGAVAADAMFELAMAQSEAGQHAEAADNFLNVAILYSDADFAPQALYMAGQSFEQAGANDEAVKAYQSLVKDYPDATEWTEKASGRLQDLVP